MLSRHRSLAAMAAVLAACTGPAARTPEAAPTTAGSQPSMLIAAGAVATLTVLPGAHHEDPAFMRTRLEPTYAFLDNVFGR